jgi:tetratricopeptide (TPR) repeat protein
LERGKALATEVLDHFSLALLQNVTADAEHYAGRPERALNMYREFTDATRKQGNRQQAIWGLAGAAECLISLGRHGEALPLLDDMLLWPEHADPVSVIRYLGVRALVELRSGEREAAQRTLDEMIERRKQNPQITYALIWALAGAAQVAHELKAEQSGGRTDRAARLRADLDRFVLMFPFASRALSVNGWQRRDGTRLGTLVRAMPGGWRFFRTR